MVKAIVNTAFQKALKASIENGYIESNKPNNAKKSSVFVSMIGEAIKQRHPELEVRYQKADEAGNKTKGEWLFDVCAGRITTQVEKSVQNIMTSLVWVVESELNSALKKFGEDFSKLLIAKSENLLFVCGDMTTSEVGSEEFISARIKSTENLLKSVPFEKENLFLAFIPYTTEWVSRENHQCRVFSYDRTSKMFVEL